jgi:hemin uptake protein HemP
MAVESNNTGKATDHGANAKLGATREISIVNHRIDSRHLFVATREITIDHGGEIYRLRLTGQNKLILTK